MTKASTTQRKVGIRAISCIKTAKPRLNRVSASYAEAEKPTAACLIQMVPKTKKQLSNRTKRIVGTDPADDLRRSLLRYLSTRSFLLRFHGSVVFERRNKTLNFQSPILFCISCRNRCPNCHATPSRTPTLFCGPCPFTAHASQAARATGVAIPPYIAGTPVIVPLVIRRLSCRLWIHRRRQPANL
jgi:hypothetical protein